MNEETFPQKEFDDFFEGKITNAAYDLILNVAKLAWGYHFGQTRKFSGRPYFDHPFEVARLVWGNPHSVDFRDLVIMTCAAFLHDTVEDTNITKREIRNTCENVVEGMGIPVLKMVMELTNPSKDSPLPRSERKKMDRNHLKSVSRAAKQIKLIDRTVNLRDMVGAEAGFRKLYARESYELYNEALRDVDKRLEKELLENIITCGLLIE